MPEASADLFEQVLATLPEGVLLVGRDGLIRYANRAAATIFGLAQTDLMGVSVESVFTPSLSDQEHSIVDRFFADSPDRVVPVLETVARRADGAELPVDIALSNVGSIPPESVAAVVHVVPGGVRLREQVAALTEQLQVSQRAESVGQLAGGIAHDLNNVLSVILNYAVFAARALPEGDPVRSDIELVHAAGERAAALTHQLLLFSRQAPADPEPIDLDMVVTDLERLLRRSIGEQVRLIVSLAGNLRPVMADPRAFSHLMLNLALNARDAMLGGGTLQIATSQIDLDEAASRRYPGATPGPHVVIKVTDDGEGMTEEVARRAFEPLFSANPRRQGSGLGLATARNIVERAGGWITLASQPGKGTSVTIVLPVAQVVVPTAEREHRPHHVAGSETVLVVEDERAVLELTRRILTSAGYSVITAAGSAEAIALCQRATQPIDLLLTDVVLPEISGLDLAREVRKVHPTVRIAFMTGYSREFLERNADVSEAVVIVQKPFTSERLLTRVRTALDQEPVPLSE